MSSNKSPIDRKVLEEHGIIVSDNVYSPRNSETKVPEYVGNVIEALLEHDVQFPNTLRLFFERERLQFSEITNADEYTVLPPTTAFYDVPHDLKKPIISEIKVIEDKFEQVANLARIAREYDTSKVSTQAWEHFLQSYIFLGPEDSGIGTSGHGKLFDAWAIENNICWNAVSKLNQISENPPQPSLTYGFPVHVPDTGKTPTGFNRNELVTNFSLDTLADLESAVTCPTTHLSATERRITEGQTPERKDLICFPWALVELRSTTETAEGCYCRAAIGANAALDMHRQLQPVWVAAKDIPPVIFFTCSGPEIRVWISFLEFKGWETSTTCICIWAGTLTATWCIVVLREIIQNTTFWASRVLKPQISARISQIRSRVSAFTANPHGAIPFRKETAADKPQALEDANESKSEKPNLSADGDSSSQQGMFIFGPSSIAPVETEKSHDEHNKIFKNKKPVESVPSGSLFSEQSFKPFDATVNTEKPHAENTNTSKSEKPVSSAQTGLLFSESDFQSFDAEVKAKKPASNVQSGFLSAEPKFSIIQSSDATVKTRKVTYVWHNGKKILVRLPINDERKPRRVTEADWNVKFYSWLRARQAVTSGQTALVDKQNASESGEAVAEISGGLQTLQIGQIDEAEGIEEGNGKLGVGKSTADSGEGELETKKSPTVDAEKQATQAGPSHTPKDKIFGKYFIYRTKESFHARTYDAAIWDSDGENDQSYVSSVSGSEGDSEGSDVDIEDDDADDEGSESPSSKDYDDASIEELLSDLKIENESVDSSSASVIGPPGQVGNLTLDVINDLLFTSVNVISGDRFMALHPIQLVLLDLKGVDLLDATWRALENWEGKSPNLYSDQMRHLLATVEYLNDFVQSQDGNSINPFKHHHLTMALRKDDLDKTLQKMQKKGDWMLRQLLRSLLTSWDGETCMEILSNELLEMTPEMFDQMLDEAFDVVYSDYNLLNTVP
ncbi:hypothetical protein TCE0_047f18121 [Talaromyces pinophilus]|uniref:Uncharacterized protein n=1 Tax=Talaromyces pinophilus TaxID=128442 RepID=A0A0B8MYS7_TALPI|nr:hypothetical protein TCE0_047f18121 [Talaromyces pinophilus]